MKIETSRSQASNSRAFTLIEVVLVLGVIGLFLAIAAVRTNVLIGGSELKKAAQEVFSTVAWVRTESLSAQTPLAIEYRIKEGEIWIVDQDPSITDESQVQKPQDPSRIKRLPSGIRFKEVARLEKEASSAQEPQYVGFSRYGICEGHRIVLVNKEGREMEIDILPIGAEMQQTD